ncbi:MAG TPA: DUF4105 domain-containing protein [Anaeromyxobacteraceae bacterium]|nr:DUF4105 domain-containing protein [Anaeromyxobacteraceae bacterium]
MPSQDPGRYLAELTATARQRHLAADREWLRLVRYRSRLLGGVESEAADSNFFLAPNGKNDPEAELEATLAGFFSPARLQSKKHPQCQFPARLAWLAERLSMDRSRLPTQRCPDLEAFQDRLRAKSVTLVFSSYYLNNPASAFGHTFLRVNKADAALNSHHFELVDYGIDYAATADTGNALLYAVKGLTGLFQGHWNHYPYFYKVREYADYESRDLWEYDLELSPRETEMLVLHLWELGSTWFRYYYLTENCSYGVMAALEAAAPRLELLQHLGPIIIPGDTVRALYANPGLVRAVHFRPSIRAQFRMRVSHLTAAEGDAVERLIKAPAASITGLSPIAEARALDAALDYVDLTYARELLGNVVTPAADLKQRLMERRSSLLVQSDELTLPAPESLDPHRAHGSLRAGVGAGASTRNGPLTVYDFRLALHDLADPPTGYPALSQIEFLPVRLRYEPRSNAFGLEEGFLADVFSLSDFGRFEHHISWRARFGATTVRDSACSDCLAGIASLGGGFAKSLAADRVTAFALLDSEVLGGPHLSGIDGSRVRVGLGPAAGIRLRFGDRASLLCEGGWRFLPEAVPRTTFDVRVTARVYVGRFSLWADAARWPLESQFLSGVSLFF